MVTIIIHEHVHGTVRLIAHTLNGSPSTVNFNLALKLSPVTLSVISYLLQGPRVGRTLKSDKKIGRDSKMTKLHYHIIKSVYF